MGAYKYIRESMQRHTRKEMRVIRKGLLHGDTDPQLNAWKNPPILQGEELLVTRQRKDMLLFVPG